MAARAPRQHPGNQARMAPAVDTSTLSGASVRTQVRLAGGGSASIPAVRRDRRRPAPSLAGAWPRSYFLILVWTVAVLLRVRGPEHQICLPAAPPPAPPCR